MARTIRTTKSGHRRSSAHWRSRASRSPAAPAEAPTTAANPATPSSSGTTKAPTARWARPGPRPSRSSRRRPARRSSSRRSPSSRSRRRPARCSTPTRLPTSWSSTRATRPRASSPSTGLITDISDAVDEYGWADKLAPSLQTTAKYSEDGVMGGDTWYGIPNYGEFVGVYYNQDAFAAAGLEIPTTYDEFIAVLDAFVATGHHPARRGRGRVPAGPALVPARAQRRPTASSSTTTSSTRTRSTGRVPRSRPRPTTLQEYVDKGYIASDVSSIKAEDAGVAVHQRHRADLRLGLVVVSGAS